MTRIAMTTTALAAAGLMIAGLAVAKDKMGAMKPGARMATAMLMTADGTPVGRATVREVVGGLRLTVAGVHLPEGQHGAHIHTVGKCEGPDFMSAGGHWNPTMHKHGSMNPEGPHQGDLPNLVVAKNGKGNLGINLPGATLEGLLDADGSAIVIHAKVDDMMTDPSGNSGARIACGVFVAQ
jgi:Cu-Zn family superoxide dismutase